MRIESADWNPKNWSDIAELQVLSAKFLALLMYAEAPEHLFPVPHKG